MCILNRWVFVQTICQKLLQKDEKHVSALQMKSQHVSALQIQRRVEDGAYIQLNLKGSGADKILHYYEEGAPIICFLLDKWRNNPGKSENG